jgi:CRISPR-associated endonuclease Csy4
MDSYIDIRIKPDAEMRQNVLLNKVYTKLHKTLWELKTRDIGVSFPEWEVLLGRVIRIHATSHRIEELQTRQWLGGLSGYCDVSEIQVVPQQTKYRKVSRIRTNMSQSKLKRLLKRGSISASEAKTYRAKMFASGLDNPYLELESNSNRHKHRRYLHFGELVNQPSEGEFDSFGLSKTATIPWF